jgi:hypothetical protein
MRTIKGFSLIALTFLLLGWLFAYLGPQSNLTFGFENAIRSDGMGYYAWTQFFIQDQNLCFDNIKAIYTSYSPENSWVIKPIENSNCYLPIYPYGLGVLLIPFFVISFILTLGNSFQDVDALSYIFQIVVSASGFIFTAFGLSFLARGLLFLNVNYSKQKSYFIILSILLGSNLFHYATYDGVFSHASSFLLNSILIFSIIYFFFVNYNSRLHLFSIGFIPWFGATIRPTNITFVLFTILVFIFLFKHRMYVNLKYLSYGSFIGVIFVLFQLLLWKLASGSFLYFTYYDYEGFAFQPNLIVKTFFSFNPHGLLPWSPIIILALLGARKSFQLNHLIFITSFTVFTINSMIFASWSQPFGGGGFGNRLFIDLYPLLLIPIALAFKSASKTISVSLYIYCLLCAVVTTHLTYQYWKGEIDFGGIPFDQYYLQLSELIYFIV